MTNSKISTKSSRNVLALALTAGILFAISGCQKSDTPTETDASTDGVDTGVGTGTPQNIALSFGNAEGNIDFIGTRLNMVSAEIFRTVERLAVVPSLNARLALVNSGGLPSDPFDPSGAFCDGTTPAGVEVTEYQDNGVANILDGFDRVAFSYDTAGCTTSTSGTRDIIPGKLGGLIILAFSAGTTAPDLPSARTFIGTAEFINYAYDDGLLFVGGSGTDQILSGQVDFNITFDGAINTTTLSSANGVQLAGGTGDLSSPVTLSFDSVVRTIDAAGDARMTITGGAATSELSGTQILFSTMPYPDPAGPDELFGSAGIGPESGALLFAGANNTSVLVPSVLNGNTLTEAQIDEDGNGYNIFPETDDPHIPKSWQWLVLGFLIPGP